MPYVRDLAPEALRSIFEGGVKPKEALEPLSVELDGRDRAFLMEVVYGVLRRRDTLDWALKGFLKAPGRLDARTLNNLRAGAYQIFFMRVPEWAAVYETVEAEKRNRGLVNAVLRSALREKDRLLQGLKDMEAAALSPSTADAERIKGISTLTSHPLWLIKRWAKRFGHEEAYALATANNKIPPLTLRVNTLRAGREEALEKLRAMGLEGEPAPYSPEGIKLKGTVPFRELAPLRGLVAVQDEGAQLIAHLLAPEPGERVLDACAAPGGKTTHIAQMMEDRGEVVAVDVSAERLKALRENVEAFGLASVKVVEGDAARLDLGLFDRVLVDAPCSSTGVIRRNPDVRYRHKAGDLALFGKKQERLLRAVSGSLRPGGLLVYCTCSTEPEEGEDVVGEFLKAGGGSFIIDGAPRFAGLMDGGFLRTYPHRHDMDGFFAARLRRTQ